MILNLAPLYIPEQPVDVAAVRHGGAAAAGTPKLRVRRDDGHDDALLRFGAKPEPREDELRSAKPPGLHGRSGSALTSSSTTSEGQICDLLNLVLRETGFAVLYCYKNSANLTFLTKCLMFLWMNAYLIFSFSRERTLKVKENLSF